MTALVLASIVALATVASGLLPFWARVRMIDMRYLVGFAAGAMVSIAIFDMVPEMDVTAPLPMALGFFATYLLEKLVLIHACGEAECESHAVGWVALIRIAAERPDRRPRDRSRLALAVRSRVRASRGRTEGRGAGP